ncbi:putative nuclease HARBI1 [Acyrthosiphon pisum]|uniref:DDE Tnp4 domain-containing protein n=1 Tax=Acyrthosiphon pisum TaxID=7029 RepID=A0A8R2F994_ACYPI|nr:putative nuclease HARBI1 [Acyrthosiphon pisum]|eukprot:XP_008182278.1 PREDICTED: putative nuclease HARBI1 [Acyrthosiphon pisum]
MDDLDLYVQLNGVELLEQIEEDAEIVLQKYDFIDPFQSLSDRQFIRFYRLSKDLATKVVQMVTPFMKAPSRSSALTMQQKVMTALRFFASGSYQMDIGVSHYASVSQPSVSRIVEEVTTALCRPEIFDEIICDVNLRILNVSARYPGSSHDSHIWNTSNIKALMTDLHAQGHKSYMLLGDSGYALRAWLLTPFLDPRPDTPEANYNDVICKARSTIERCNGVLKMRFRCLLKHRTLHYAPNKASKIINSCVVLHNLCIMDNIPLYNEDFDTNEVDYGIFQQNNVDNAHIDDRGNPELTAGQRARQQIVDRYFT